MGLRGLVAAFFALWVGPARASVIWSGDAETGDLSQWSGAAYTCSVNGKVYTDPGTCADRIQVVSSPTLGSHSRYAYRYSKIGYYRHSDISGTSQTYIDDYRVGTSYADVVPGGGGDTGGDAGTDTGGDGGTDSCGNNGNGKGGGAKKKSC